MRGTARAPGRGAGPSSGARGRASATGGSTGRRAAGGGRAQREEGARQRRAAVRAPTGVVKPPCTHSDKELADDDAVGRTRVERDHAARPVEDRRQQRLVLLGGERLPARGGPVGCERARVRELVSAGTGSRQAKLREHAPVTVDLDRGRVRAKEADVGVLQRPSGVGGRSASCFSPRSRQPELDRPSCPPSARRTSFDRSGPISPHAASLFWASSSWWLRLCWSCGLSALVGEYSTWMTCGLRAEPRVGGSSRRP